MTTHARLAGLLHRYNRKTLAVVLCALIVSVVVVRGISVAASTPADSVLPQTPAVVGSSGVGGPAATGDAGTTTSADGEAAPSTYVPSVDDLTGPTVVYDDGTGDQMPYVPSFDPGS